LLSEEIEEVLSREMEEGEEANRRSRLLASLQHIVAGRRLVVCMVPFEARQAAPDSRFDLGYPMSGESGAPSVLSIPRKGRSAGMQPANMRFSCFERHHTDN
jgi:hypothetical protein